MATGMCKFCGKLITWGLTKNGKWQPLNLDGSVHFPTCRGAVAEGREAVAAWYAEMDKVQRLEIGRK